MAVVRMDRIIASTSYRTVEFAPLSARTPFFLEALHPNSFQRSKFSSKKFSTSIVLKVGKLGGPRKLRSIVSLAKLDGSDPFAREARGESSNVETSAGENLTPSISPLTSPTEFVEWGGQLPSRRRLLLGGALASFASLGSNFLGSTSFILSKFPQTARNWKLDQIYPVDGFLRCVEKSTGFEFLYPQNWVGDQTLLYRAASRAEQERSLDPPTLRQGRRHSAVSEPVVAFGPPGSNGELNVSVIVAPVPAGFSLEAFGSPTDVGNRLLNNAIAPPGSDKEARLLSASKRSKGQVLYYTLEFTVHSPSFFRHNLAVYAAYNGSLFSLNGQSSETSWSEFEESFAVAANSFEVLESRISLIPNVL